MLCQVQVKYSKLIIYVSSFDSFNQISFELDRYFLNCQGQFTLQRMMTQTKVKGENVKVEY
jgi:hypothetical protein